MLVSGSLSLSEASSAHCISLNLWNGNFFSLRFAKKSLRRLVADSTSFIWKAVLLQVLKYARITPTSRSHLDEELHHDRKLYVAFTHLIAFVFSLREFL